MKRLVILAAVLGLGAPALAQAAPAGLGDDQAAPPATTPSPGMTELKASEPAPNATVSSPKEFSLTFPHPMKLTELTVTPKGGASEQIPVPAGDPVEKVTVPVTKPLKPGGYKAAWRAVGADGHKMQGSWRFTVK